MRTPSFNAVECYSHQIKPDTHPRTSKHFTLNEACLLCEEGVGIGVALIKYGETEIKRRLSDLSEGTQESCCSSWAQAHTLSKPQKVY